MSRSRLHEPLARVERWCQEGEALPEKALETLLLLEIFRDGLGYSHRNAVSQHKADPKRKGVTDITLKPSQREKRQWIVIEIKRPGKRGGRDLAGRAVQQAGSYLVSQGATRGIVTDGCTWKFIWARLKPRATRIHFIESLLRLDVSHDRQRRILEAALGRCGKGTARRFFAMLEAIRDFGPARIAAVTEGRRSQWATAIQGAIHRTTGQRFAQGDVAVLRLICGGHETLVHCLLDEYRHKALTVKMR
jgi:hypothetical protein